MKFLALLLCLCSLIGCSATSPTVEKLQGRTMGTGYSVMWPQQSEINPEQIQHQIDQLLVAINKKMSTYDLDSELSQFNHASAPYQQTISSELAEILTRSLELNTFSNGYFDISVGPLVNLWGFGPGNKSFKTPETQRIVQTLQQTGLGVIQLKGNSLVKSKQRYLDLSAIAKGYAVDRVSELLDSMGIENYLVEIGGEIRVKGAKSSDQPWKVAVEAPDFNARRVQKILSLKDMAMATSGDYRNYFEDAGQRYSHSIDPFTGLPVKHQLASVTILHENCARADALATAMLVMGDEKAKEFAEVNNIRAYMIVRDQDSFKEHLSPAFSRWLNP